METYDYIIAGGGCAGLSLAYYLSQSGQAGKKILIIDRSEKEANDRTWCFWTDEPTAFQEIVHREWSSLSFREGSAVYRSSLGKGRYQMIRGLDFYRYVKDHLAAFSNIRFLRASIQYIAEDKTGPYVMAGDEIRRARWIFDSTIDHRRWGGIRKDHQFLWQHFRGWIIQTPESTFDPEDAVLMDFRNPQHGNARFFYLLPLNDRQALLEYTIFSPDLLSPDEYERQLERYCREKLRLKDYQVLERESGKIPMTDAPIIPTKGRHIVPIGTPGGAVKPSTGYAFLRIQQQVKAIVEELERGAPPSHPRPPAGRFHFYDRLLLHLLLHEGNRAKAVFCHLFRHNSMRRILRFLDERSRWRQEALIFARLPFGPFLRACWALYVKPWLRKRRTKSWMVGETSNILEKQNVNFLVNTAWGAFALLVPIIWHYDEALPIITQITGRETVSLSVNARLAICLGIVLINWWILFYYAWKGKLTRRNLRSEILNTAVLSAVFYFLPLLLGFAVYFVFWHSLSSMLDQIRFFRRREHRYGWRDYVRNALPFSVVAVLGLVILVWGQWQLGLNMGIGILFIFISIVTLPHMILIDRLYAEWDRVCEKTTQVPDAVFSRKG